MKYGVGNDRSVGAWNVMMVIAPNSRARKGDKERGEVKGEYGGIWKEGNADYGGMVNPVSNMVHHVHDV